MATKPTRFAQMGDTTEKVKVYTGIPKRLVVDTSKWKIHLMDGATPGGYEVAMPADVAAGLHRRWIPRPTPQASRRRWIRPSLKLR